MVSNGTEIEMIADLTQLQGGFYSKVKANFSTYFLPMLVVNELANKLPEELRTKPLLKETGENALVIHIGSVKLVYYPKDSWFSVQLMATQEKDGIAISFYYDNEGLSVEYTSVTKFRGPDRFVMPLPNTYDHQLHRQLGALCYIVRRIHYHDGDINDLRTILDDNG